MLLDEIEEAENTQYEGHDEMAQAQMESLAEHLEHAENIVGLIGNTGMTGHYQKAARRIKTHLYGDSQRREQWGGEPVRQPRSKPPEWTDDEKVVLACIQTARKHRGVEPFSLARQIKGWTKDRWDNAVLAYESKRMERNRLCSIEHVETE